MQLSQKNSNRISLKAENERIVNSFLNFYDGMNYRIEPSKNITCGCDASVYLIGSSISVLKPLLLNNSIPNEGVAIVQPAIRTQQLQNLYRNDSFFSEWGSYFKALGTLQKYEKVEEVINDTYQFIIGAGNMDSEILIRVCSRDTDLLSACQKIIPYIKTEVDTMSEKYYKHKYGMDLYGIRGRNFNFCLKDKNSGMYGDVGNIIIIEKDNEPIAVESAIGLSALITRMCGFSHTVQSTVIADFIDCKDYDYCRFADCIAVISHLFAENIKPNSSNMASRLLKKYLIGVIHYATYLHFTFSRIYLIMKEYVTYEYNLETAINVIENCSDYITKNNLVEVK